MFPGNIFLNYSKSGTVTLSVLIVHGLKPNLAYGEIKIT